MYGEKIETKKLVSVELTAEELEIYTGTYTTPDFPLDIVVYVKNNKLFCQATGQGAIEMQAFKNHIFTFQPAQIELTFNPENQSMLLEQGSMKVLFEKEKP